MINFCSNCGFSLKLADGSLQGTKPEEKFTEHVLETRYSMLKGQYNQVLSERDEARTSVEWQQAEIDRLRNRTHALNTEITELRGKLADSKWQTEP